MAGNTPAEEYLGYSVSIYYKTDDDGTNQIVYVSKDNKRNNTYTVKTEDVTGYSEGKLYWQDGDKKKNKNLPASADILYNGKAAAFSESLFAGENGEITMIDNTGDDEIDVVMVRAYENMVIGSVDYTKYKVYDKYASGILLDFKELKQEQYKITDFGAEEPLMFEDLSEGDLISYFVSEDKSYIEIVRGTQTVTGTVEAMGEERLTIDGKEYPMSSYLGQKDQKIKNGDSGEFVLDVQGRISKFTLEDGGAMRYGYVITMKKGEGVDSSYQMKILCDDGTIAIYSVADKLIVDRGTFSASALEERLTADGKFRMQLIRYRLNDNKIKEVDTAELSSEEDENSLVRGADKMLRKYKSYAKSFLLDFNITDGTKIFRVPDPEDESSADLLLEDKNFDCVGPSNFVHDRDYTVEGFDLEDGNVAKAAVIYMKGVEEVSAGSTLVLVDKVTSTINEDGVETGLLHCLANGKHTEYVAKEKGVLLPPELGRNVKRGDVIRLSTDKNNQITAVSLDLDITKLDKTQRAYKGTFMTDFYEFGGLVRNKGNGYFVVDGQRLYNNVVQDVSLAPSAGGYVYIYDSEADSIYNGSFDDVICGDTAETASYVLVRMSYETCKEVIVFK